MVGVVQYLWVPVNNVLHPRRAIKLDRRRETTEGACNLHGALAFFIRSGFLVMRDERDVTMTATVLVVGADPCELRIGKRYCGIKGTRSLRQGAGKLLLPFVRISNPIWFC